MEDGAVEELPLSFLSPLSNSTPASSISSASNAPSTGSNFSAKPQHSSTKATGGSISGSFRGVRGGLSIHAASNIGDGIMPLSVKQSCP
jgi:hypothetical protein